MNEHRTVDGVPFGSCICSFELLGGGAMPFANTAAYFEHKAKRAYTRAQRQHYAEAARFYRDLANITPSFPPGYQGAKLPEMGEQMDPRAALCLAMADLMRDEECKHRMLQLARTYAEFSETLIVRRVAIHAPLSDHLELS